MEIGKKIDNSRIREESQKNSVPIVDLILRKIKDISRKEKINHTLLAVCPNSENVLKAAIYSAKRANAPIKFTATLNQVDTDGGYTGWTQVDLVRKIKEYSYRIGYNGPTMIAVDHGGPWLKDKQAIEKWNLERSMKWIKKSFEAAVIAGYDLIHVDPTVDIFVRDIKIETVVERTIDLISHVEKFRKSKKIKPISYEVGTEEVHGGLADIGVFKEFLKLFKEGLNKINLGYIYPSFIVGKVGTDLHTSTFDASVAEELVEIAKNYGSVVKGHYTDFVSNPEDYPRSGIGAANVGPEFTILEYEGFLQLGRIEDEFYNTNKIACRSNFVKVLEKAVVESGRWKKWLQDGEVDIKSMDKKRKEWIIGTGSRYVWAKPEVKCSKMQLFKNLELNGIDAENWVTLKIESGIDKYLREFNLINLNDKLGN